MSHVDFALAVTSWLSARRSAHTHDAYRRDLERYIDWWQRDHVESPLTTSDADLVRYRDHLLAHDLAASTVARYLSSLASFFGHAAEGGVIGRVPLAPRAPAREQRPDRVLARAQLQALVGAASDLGPRESLLIALLLFDDVRLHELLSADVDDVTADADGRVWLDRGARGATMIDHRGAGFVEALVAGREMGPLLLGQGSGDRLTRFGADYLLRQVSARAGLFPSVTAATLRRQSIPREPTRG